jgi:hypothetical protein
MGDVIKPPQWTKPNDGPQDYDNLGPVTPKQLDDMYWLANALKVGDVEVIRPDKLCGHCADVSAERCFHPKCPFYVAPAEDDGA